MLSIVQGRVVDANPQRRVGSCRVWMSHAPRSRSWTIPGDIARALVASSLLVSGCGAARVPAEERCADEPELAAIAAVLGLDHVERVASRFGECTLGTSAGDTRLLASRRATVAFVTSCWARGGPAERACDHTQTDAEGQDWTPTIAIEIQFSLEGAPRAESDVIGPLADRAETSATHWPPGAADTVYVEFGSYAQAFGYTVQRIDGAWRVVERRLAWTT